MDVLIIILEIIFNEKPYPLDLFTVTNRLAILNLRIKQNLNVLRHIR